MEPPEFSFNLDERLEAKAKTELNENEDTRRKGLKDLKNFLRSEKGLQFQDDDDFLLQFLRGKKFNVQKAFECCKCHYSYKVEDLYGNIQVSTIIKGLKSRALAILPSRNPDGSAIICLDSGYFHYESCPPKEGIQASIGFLEILHMDPSIQISGYTVILNCRGITFAMTKARMRETILTLFYGLKCFPGRYVAVHLPYMNRWARYCVLMVKYLLSEKLRRRLFYYGDDLEEFHRHVPKSILPEECGGDLGPIDPSYGIALAKKLEKQYEKCKKYGYLDKRKWLTD